MTELGIWSGNFHSTSLGFFAKGRIEVKINPDEQATYTTNSIIEYTGIFRSGEVFRPEAHVQPGVAKLNIDSQCIKLQIDKRTSDCISGTYISTNPEDVGEFELKPGALKQNNNYFDCSIS